MPPLKSDRASPTLQMAWPGMGCGIGSAVELQLVKPEVPYLDVVPLVRTRRVHLEAAKPVVQE